MTASSDLPERLAVAVPPLDAAARRRAVEQDWEPDLLDPRDPDERAVLIRLAHPDLEDGIRDGVEEVRIGRTAVNPRLHLAIHEVVAAQIVDDDPPEVFATAQRLVGGGYDRHEVLHMLASAMTAQIWSATHEERPYDRAEHERALRALPGSWLPEPGRPPPPPPARTRRQMQAGRRRRRRR